MSCETDDATSQEVLRLTEARCGRVATSANTQGYVGARKHSNNTGELTALLHAVEDELHRGDPTSAVTFHVDSLYAIHTATGKSRVRKANEQLAARLRRATQALRRGRYTGPAAVRFHHVRSHRADTHMGNNIADGLAKWAVRKELRKHGTPPFQNAAETMLEAQRLLAELQTSSSTSTSTSP